MLDKISLEEVKYKTNCVNAAIIANKSISKSPHIQELPPQSLTVTGTRNA